jgi:hypothetical protein
MKVNDRGIKIVGDILAPVRHVSHILMGGGGSEKAKKVSRII